MVHFRPAVPADLPVLLSIYEEARAFMRQSGNPDQWTGGYPGAELLQDDMAKQQLYVCEEAGQIQAVFCYFRGVDPTYLRIYDGAWLNDEPYGVIHRIAVRAQGKGIAKLCYMWALAQCNELRIDTHWQNIPMQRSLEKFGFTRCGRIYLLSGDERIAYHISKS